MTPEQFHMFAGFHILTVYNDEGGYQYDRSLPFEDQIFAALSHELALPFNGSSHAWPGLRILYSTLGVQLHLETIIPDL